MVSEATRKAVETELNEANRLWESGKKADAVAKYKQVLDRDHQSIPGGDSERATLFRRVIDNSVEQDDSDAAKAWIEKAFDKKIDITSDDLPT